jgi:hypothetical protein
VYVTTEAGTISKLEADGSSKTEFASGLNDPHGLAFVPPGLGDVLPGVYVAETGGGIITRILTDGTKVPFVTGAGSPNYMTFQSVSPVDPTPPPTPTPTPTPTGSPTPTVSPTPTPTPTPTPAGKAQNLSTRVDVGTEANVGIGGFIITGTDPKLVVIRGIGPSLADFGVTGALADPVLELHDSTGATIATNDNWMDNIEADRQMLIDHGLDPTNDLESAIIVSLDPSLYTAVVSGKDGGTGVALIEMYDLDDPSVVGELGNLSTRGLVGTNANVLIGGVIVGPEGGLDAAVVVRAIGPSLTDFGVAGALADPVLELHDSTGAIIATNDNHGVIGHGLDPTNPLESAIITTLDPGLYTAVVSGKDGGTGVALIEMYDLDDPSVAGELGNLSTRGLVGTDANVLIGGVIVGPEGGLDAAVVVRAIGPSLTDFGVTGALADPVLELRNGDGDVIAMNDNWETDPEPDNYSAEVMAAGLAPSDPSESAIYANLVTGLYTAIVSGKDATTGVGLVEVYHVATQ